MSVAATLSVAVQSLYMHPIQVIACQVRTHCPTSVEYVCLAEAQVPGLDVVIDFSSPAEACLQPALDSAALGQLSNLTAATSKQVQSIQQLVTLWNVDMMTQGLGSLVCYQASC